MLEINQRLDMSALKRRHSLAAVMAAYGVALRPAGAGRLSGCCPFHEDRRPSLLVDDRDGHFHCFGCGARGDVIDFLMRSLGLDFQRAVEHLHTTPPLPTTALPSERHQRRGDRLTREEQDVLQCTAALYRQTLWRTPTARAYLRRRGLPDWLSRRCGLGYADGRSLERCLRLRGRLGPARDLGLLGPDGRERLAGRVVVPEVRGGYCRWLIGRRLDDDGALPRYLSLSGTRPLLGQEHVAGQPAVFVCEGVFDYLTALSWGLPACCLGGTTLPVAQLGALANARLVYTVFDGDAAGRAAAARLRAELGERVRPIVLPEGQDLNDLGQQAGGSTAFSALLAAQWTTKGESLHVG